jgi:hypothetical protein
MGASAEVVQASKIVAVQPPWRLPVGYQFAEGGRKGEVEVGEERRVES